MSLEFFSDRFWVVPWSSVLCVRGWLEALFFSYVLGKGTIFKEMTRWLGGFESLKDCRCFPLHKKD
jgi:hypothetical protein